MALIKCPECNKEISDKAQACIHCGYYFKQKNSILCRLKKIHKIVILTILALLIGTVVSLLFLSGVIGEQLGTPYTGLIPDGTHFNAKCTASEGSLIVEFREDGTFVKKFDLFGLRTESFYGIYERRGNIIEVKFDSGGIIVFIVKNNSLYEKNEPKN